MHESALMQINSYKVANDMEFSRLIKDRPFVISLYLHLVCFYLHFEILTFTFRCLFCFQVWSNSATISNRCSDLSRTGIGESVGSSSAPRFYS